MTHEKFSKATLREAKVPGLHENANKDIDAVNVRIKLYDRESGWAWYITSADEETGTCFGWQVRHTAGSLAFFQLKDLNAMQGKQGVNIRRDQGWNPQTSLAEVIEEKVI